MIDLKEAFAGVVKAVDQQRRDDLRKFFSSPNVDERVANASTLIAKLSPWKAKLSPETWANVEAQIDMASATGDTSELEAAVDAADAEIKANKPQP